LLMMSHVTAISPLCGRVHAWPREIQTSGCWSRW